MQKVPAYAWAVVALLWPVVVLNYLDRQMLSTMGLSIKTDIVELQSARNFGWLMAIFLWVYAFCSPVGGAIADRLNRKWLIVASLGVWSSVTLLMGQAVNFHQLFALRAIMGVSEALYMPAALALIADYHRGPTRSLAVGAHLSGVYMGQALGGIGGWVAQEVSWRAAFAGCGAIGVAYALVLMIFLRDTDRGAPEEVASPSVTGAAAGVNWRGFVILALCFSLPSLSGWAVKNWLPTLLQDRFGMTQAPSGLWATITHAGAAFCGVIFGGWLADRWAQRTARGRTYLSAVGLALLVPGILLIGLAPGFALAISGSLLFGFGFGMFDANNMPILCQLAPARFRATGYGLLNFFGIASGACLTPLLGHLKDSGMALADSFAYCSVPALLAAVLMFLLRPKDRDRGVLISA
ncbi:MAG: MFS transporter [Limisphaerales bacterium]